MERLNGIVPVMITPMLEGGEPDEESIDRLVNYLIEQGMVGLWTLGSAGEANHITWKQRVKVVRASAAAVNGRIPILTGTGATSINEILEFINEIEASHVDGIHVLYRDPKQGDSRMIAELTRLADRSPIPIWLYHNPTSGKAVSTQVIKALRDHPNIQGMKVGGYSLNEMTQALLLDTPTFQVIGAGGGQLFTMLCLGATAHTTGDSCWPEEFLKLYSLFCEGRLVDAREQQFRLIRLARSLPRTDNGESCAEEKYILSLRGICHEYVNPAYRTLTLEEKAGVRQVLSDYGFEWSPKD